MRAFSFLFLCYLAFIAGGFPVPGTGLSLVAAEKKALKVERGLASFYGKKFQGKETASGETFDMHELVAAHPSLPLGTVARVTNLENNRTVEVRINDRGPSEQNRTEGVIIDLSREAAEALDFIKEGRVHVQVEVLELGSGGS